MAEKYPLINREKVKKEYADLIEAAKKKWDETSPEWKEEWWAGLTMYIGGFLLLWDTLKEIEKKFGIDPWNIAREQRWKQSFATGQAIAKNYKQHGLKELYDAWPAVYEGVADQEFPEFDENVLAIHVHKCPCIETFKKMGRTDEEIKEMAPLFCLADYALMTGFNPELDNFPQATLVMKGNPYCSYRTEDNRPKERRGK